MGTIIRVTAPGKIIVFGEHAVVYGKQALAASLNLRTELTINNNKEDIINLKLPSIGVNLSWTLQEILKLRNTSKDKLSMEGFYPCEDINELRKFAANNSANFFEDESTKSLAVIAFLHLFRSIVLSTADLKFNKGITIQVTSLIPTSAGLGSSAAYSVCLAAGFLLYSNPTIAKNPIVDMSDKNCGLFERNELDWINGWAFVAEKIIHGKPSGIDNSVSTFGKAMWYENGVFSLAENMPHLNVLLINTKISRNTKTLVERVKIKRDKYPEIYDPILNSIEGVCVAFKKMLNDLDVNICDDAQFQNNLTELIELNERLLELLGVGHEAITRICDVLDRYNLRGKLTGAGGGGCVFTVVPKNYDEELILKLKNEFDKLDFDCFTTSLGGQGVNFELF